MGHSTVLEKTDHQFRANEPRTEQYLRFCEFASWRASFGIIGSSACEIQLKCATVELCIESGEVMGICVGRLCPFFSERPIPSAIALSPDINVERADCYRLPPERQVGGSVRQNEANRADL
jgi:hypothetical protein